MLDEGQGKGAKAVKESSEMTGEMGGNDNGESK